MSPSEKRSFRLYLNDILTSAERIDEYLGNLSYEEFIRDPKTMDAVIRNLEIIGEAAKKVPGDIKEKYTEVPWEGMYRLRNQVSHEYFGVDLEIIWDIIKNYLPKNYLQLKDIEKAEGFGD